MSKTYVVKWLNKSFTVVSARTKQELFDILDDYGDVTCGDTLILELKPGKSWDSEWSERHDPELRDFIRGTEFWRGSKVHLGGIEIGDPPECARPTFAAAGITHPSDVEADESIISRAEEIKKGTIP